MSVSCDNKKNKVIPSDFFVAHTYSNFYIQCNSLSLTGQNLQDQNKNVYEGAYAVKILDNLSLQELKFNQLVSSKDHKFKFKSKRYYFGINRGKSLDNLIGLTIISKGQERCFNDNWQDVAVRICLPSASDSQQAESQRFGRIKDITVYYRGDIVLKKTRRELYARKRDSEDLTLPQMIFPDKKYRKIVNYFDFSTELVGILEFNKKDYPMIRVANNYFFLTDFGAEPIKTVCDSISSPPSWDLLNSFYYYGFKNSN